MKFSVVAFCLVAGACAVDVENNAGLDLGSGNPRCNFKKDMRIEKRSSTGAFFTHGLSLEMLPQAGTFGWESMGDFTKGVEPFAEIVRVNSRCWSVDTGNAKRYTLAVKPSNHFTAGGRIFSLALKPADEDLKAKIEWRELAFSIMPYLNFSTVEFNRGAKYVRNEFGALQVNDGAKGCFKFTKAFLHALNALPSTFDSPSDINAYFEFVQRFGWEAPMMTVLGHVDWFAFEEDERSLEIQLASFGSKLQSKDECKDPAPVSLKYQDWAELRNATSAFTNKLSIAQAEKLTILSDNLPMLYGNLTASTEQETHIIGQMEQLQFNELF